jgi:mono/diheme cytochrome c family protein
MLDALYSLLKAVGFDEPIHSPITHLPIGLVVGAFVFFVVALVFKKKQLVPTARYSAILAFVFAFPTILFGVFDWMHFYHAVLMPAIIIKMTLAGVVLVTLAAAIILGGEVKLHSAWLMTLYAIAFVAVMGLGYFGAGIVYGRAVAAAPAPAATTKSATITSAANTASPEFTRGRALFNASCIACHGGGGNAIVASLPLKTSAKLGTLDTFKTFVRNPTMPDGSAGEMPAFTPDQIKDGELVDLYAYVTQAWK